jgi:hypothetical protein
MFKELWQRIKTKQRSGAKLTRKEQILAEKRPYGSRAKGIVRGP